MSFVGSCVAQAVVISSQDGRLSAVETLAASKVATSVYEAKMALLDGKDVAHEARLDTVEGRATALEGRATALESDITGRVQAAIDEKVAQTVFDSLASELRDADSALTAALATKVAATTQAAVDAAQNDVIATKASIAGVNNALNSLIGSFNSEIERLDGEDASARGRLDALEGWRSANVDPHLAGLDDAVYGNLMGRVGTLEGKADEVKGRVDWLYSNVNPHLSDIDAKTAAIEEFIRAMLATYTITKPDGTPYSYTGVAQGLTF